MHRTHTPSFLYRFKVTKDFKSPSIRPCVSHPSRILWACLFFPPFLSSFLSLFLFLLYWSELIPHWLPGDFPERNVTAGMFTVAFTPRSSPLPERVSPNVVIRIMDGVYWAHKDTLSLSSAVHRFTTSPNTNIPETYQPVVSSWMFHWTDESQWRSLSSRGAANFKNNNNNINKHAIAILLYVYRYFEYIWTGDSYEQHRKWITFWIKYWSV